MSTVHQRLRRILNHLPGLGGDNLHSNVDEAILDLRQQLAPDQVDVSLEKRATFGTTWGTYSPPTPASVVVHAQCTEDVVKVVKIASKHAVIVIPTAGRTSLEGQFLPPTCCEPLPEHRNLPRPGSKPPPNTFAASLNTRPSIHLDTSAMDKILAIHPKDSQAVVQPGVGWKELSDELAARNHPLFFPIDPAPKALLGGMVAVSGSGTNAVGYGTMKAEWIQGMEVVLMSGEVIRTRGKSRSRKTSTGWDVGRLFMGSEGTLGIITELTVRLAPVVPLRVAMTSFPTVSQAVDAVVTMLGAGLTPTSLELLDGTSIRGLNMAELLDELLPEEPTVMMRFSSPVPEVITSSLETVAKIVKDNGGRALRIARDEQENERLWNARKAQYWSQQLLVGEGCRVLITDICVPISKLADFIRRSEDIVRTSGLLAPIVAHIGDGNVHRAILYKAEPGTNAAPAAVAELASDLSKLAIDLDGTCAGEHGIGTSKRKYLRQELGPGTLAVMRRIKAVLDPQNLLNPGKVLYESIEEENDESLRAWS